MRNIIFKDVFLKPYLIYRSLKNAAYEMRLMAPKTTRCGKSLTMNLILTLDSRLIVAESREMTRMKMILSML